MKILYLGYWSSGDVLTQSVIIPRLKILSELDNKIDQIFFCSVERHNTQHAEWKIPRVTQVFFNSKQKSNLFLTKRSDFKGLFLMLDEIVRQNKISFVICNSPLAGIVGYHLHKRNNLPFVVECFEPHALYMLEAGTWKVWDPRYWILRYAEWQQKKSAFKLVTVSKAYSAKLGREGVPESRIVTMPNCIPLELFRFNETRRTSKRLELGINTNDCVGIYVGKFGDIYYDEEAFDLFAEAFNYFGNKFWLIILTSASRDGVVEKLKQRNINQEHVYVSQVLRNEVPDFMSAADFAFSTIRPSPARIYCCPIKNGEYWANGLPVLMEDGIGEDSEIIKNEGGGVIMNNLYPSKGFEQLSDLMKNGRTTNVEAIFSIAVKHRRMELLSDYYKLLFDQQSF